MENLKEILKLLMLLKNNHNRKYYIPEVWNSWGFKGFSTNEGRKGEICVNPYAFAIECIKKNILPYYEGNHSSLKALDCEKNREPELKNSVVYSMLPRMFTAWRHYDSNEICTGTLLKTICLLPYLKNMNVNIICLMPVFEYSDIHKKGEIGSPYAIKNMYALDKNLHDDLLGDNTEDLLNMEFKAFMEASHILDIKVMMDFSFRTVARDNDLIICHPDWFYWIDLKYADGFKIPYVEKEQALTVLDDRSLKSLYTCSGINEYLSMFTLSPEQIDNDKWQKLKDECLDSGGNILDMIEKAYQITTVPGFSDVLNDIQPLWTDATYLKYYYGVDSKVAGYVKEEQPPYILLDSVCLNLYSGQACNCELWNYIVDVIPFFQKNFGIDGARIDSGHVLPPDLNRDIIKRARDENKGFILWAEEFDVNKTPAQKEWGFNFITGMLWSIHKEVADNSFNRLLQKHIAGAAIPVLASLETPDTPRLALAHSDKRMLELLILLYCFLPNTILFINNGMEAMELQPMNLGLDNTEEGRYVLDKNDPQYGKLAFFDNYHIHWTNPQKEWMIRLLSKAISLRLCYSNLLTFNCCLTFRKDVTTGGMLTPVIYYDAAAGKGVFLIANRDVASSVEVDIGLLLFSYGIKCKTICIVYMEGELCRSHWSCGKKIGLGPEGTVIGEFTGLNF